MECYACNDFQIYCFPNKFAVYCRVVTKTNPTLKYRNFHHYVLEYFQEKKAQAGAQ